MGKAAAHKEKKDQKRQIKDKKKFNNKNSIGKTRKKATKYITRTQAVAKLQVPLKDFRKLCILKGVYPREPKKKAKGSNTTYYFAKDILFLAHEPLLATFREQKAFLKKIRRACGRHERLQAERLDGRRPTYKLDHLIRERYPTFADALHELDDVLCLVFLFASLSPSKFVPASRIATCAKLRTEFLAYVTRTGAIRFTFISIKGIYYQADIQGVPLTWIEPHHRFAQQPTMIVDYRVMLSFLELYEAVLTFVNFKLYHDLGLAYPPQIDDAASAAGSHLSAALLTKAVHAQVPVMPGMAAGTAMAPTSEAQREALSSAQLADLRGKLAHVDTDMEALAPVTGDEADVGQAEETTPDDVPDGDREVAILRTVFKACFFFCSRETPVPALEVLILSCGGQVGWEGEASPFGRDDPCVTHLVVDRAAAGLPTQSVTCSCVQPQWVFDCVNARTLLPTHAYRPGSICPPHLSPFTDGNEGYSPTERIKRAAAGDREAALRRSASGRADEHAEGGVVEGTGQDSTDDDDEEEEDVEEEEEEEEGGKDDDAREYQAELTTELKGEARTAKRQKPSGSTASLSSAKEEEKALAMLTMSHKKRRLYERMQFGIARKAAAVDALRAKREALDAGH